MLQVPGRLRLVALAAVLRSQCGLEKGPQGGKGVVFLSSCAGVDFHHAVLGRVYEGVMEEPLLPCPLFRLHGNLAQVHPSHTVFKDASIPLILIASFCECCRRRMLWKYLLLMFQETCLIFCPLRLFQLSLYLVCFNTLMQSG